MLAGGDYRGAPMAKIQRERHDIDPADGLRRDVVGQWCEEKYERLAKYVDITHATRSKFASNRPSYIDLYCATGRSRVRDTESVLDGSAVLAAVEADKRSPFAEIHIGDADLESLTVCSRRLAARTQAVVRQYHGKSVDTAAQVVGNLNPYGFHVAFLDPYNLDSLPFSVIATLAAVKRMDLIVHISEMDLQRNVIGKQDMAVLEAFAPGAAQGIRPGMKPFDVKLHVLNRWKALVQALGYKVSDNIERVTGLKNQPLYWLAYASKHPLGDRFWGQVSDAGPQRGLF